MATTILFVHKHSCFDCVYLYHIIIMDRLYLPTKYIGVSKALEGQRKNKNNFKECGLISENLISKIRSQNTN